MWCDFNDKQEFQQFKIAQIQTILEKSNLEDPISSIITCIYVCETHFLYLLNYFLISHLNLYILKS